MEEIIRLESDGFDVEFHIDAVAKYLRKRGFPIMNGHRFEFIHCDAQSRGWFLSDVLDVTSVNMFRYCVKKEFGKQTNGGIMYVSGAWNEAMFVVDEHYYFMSK